MKEVADHLAGVATRAADAGSADLFGRSAFNRYYYTVFLIVRSALRQIDSGWAAPAHQDVPNILRGPVRERVRKAKNKAETAGTLSRSEAEGLYHSVSVATTALSDLLESAREVRRVADYEPETAVSRRGTDLELYDHTLAEAKGWPGRADAGMKAVLRAYGRLGII